MKLKLYSAILAAGLLAGTMDITGAMISHGLRGRSPVRVLQSVASGLLGSKSYEGGFATAALGAVLHFFIAMTAAAVYLGSSVKLPLLWKSYVVCGILYGLLVFVFMHFLVIPLSSFPGKLSFTPASLSQAILIHLVCVGLPIAFMANRFFAREREQVTIRSYS